MRKVYVALAGLQLLAVLAQFYLAALGGFDRPRDDESFGIHAMIGMTIPLIALLATGAAALSRAPGKLIGLTALPIGLGILQILIRVVADALGNTDETTTTASIVVFGLHGVNALIIMGVSGQVLSRARKLASASPKRAEGTLSTAS